MPEIRPRIVALLPDEPQANSTGGAVRAWYFLNSLARLGELHAYTLTVGANERGFKFPDGAICQINRVAPTALQEKDTKPSPFTALQNLLFPWIRQGRSLILSGYNICVSRSHLPSFSFLHQIYGFLLLTVFSWVRRLRILAPWDVHIRGKALDIQLKRIEDDWRDESPDLIWIEHSYLYTVAEALKRKFPLAKVAINAHNVEAELKKSFAANHTTWLGRSWGQEEAANVAAMERRMVSNAWLITCCSTEDLNRFTKYQSPNKNTKVHLQVAPNGVDTVYFRNLNEQSSREKQIIIFTGTAGYSPNDDAVSWLTKNIWPTIRSKHPKAQLWLAGRNAAQHWQSSNLPSQGIQLFSDVADMRPLMSQASIAIVPLRSGSGTRLKILEAFSMGLPVVSTSIGAEGLGVQDHSDILLANSAEHLANSVNCLLENESLRSKLAKAGRHRAVTEFDWQTVCARFEAGFQSAWDDSERSRL
jgi:glycosyltransferase involved in cell wall biosynthesis